MKKLTKKQISKIEDAGFSIHEAKFGPNSDFGYEISQYSSAGQDFNFAVEFGNSLEDFAENVLKYWDNYDPDEEASLWIGPDGHGANGAPYYLSDLLKDMEECKNMIYEFYQLIISFINEVKITIVKENK